MTNYHVLEYGYRVVATLYDGSEAEASVEYVNEENDIAMLRVEGGGYDYLKISDAGAVKSGDVVFVISSPMGLYDTISEGIVSYPERELNGSMYIQFTAAISFGSGGAPLLDSRGFVIGIANSSFNDGQGLNLASAAKME
jgi:S1-C subfamily serine protease